VDVDGQLTPRARETTVPNHENLVALVVLHLEVVDGTARLQARTELSTIIEVIQGMLVSFASPQVVHHDAAVIVLKL
jgi:hypothetical protein